MKTFFKNSTESAHKEILSALEELLELMQDHSEEISDQLCYIEEELQEVTKKLKNLEYQFKKTTLSRRQELNERHGYRDQHEEEDEECCDKCGQCQTR